MLKVSSQGSKGNLVFCTLTRFDKFYLMQEIKEAGLRSLCVLNQKTRCTHTSIVCACTWIYSEKQDEKRKQLEERGRKRWCVVSVLFEWNIEDGDHVDQTSGRHNQWRWVMGLQWSIKHKTTLMISISATSSY